MLTDHCTRRASERNPLAFAPLPHTLRKDRRLTTRAVTLAAALLEHARDQPRCDPTNRRLAADDHCSIRTVEYALALLRETGWVRIEQGPDGRVIHLVWREGPPAQRASAPRPTDNRRVHPGPENAVKETGDGTKNGDWHERYEAYRLTAAWQRRRQCVFTRAGGMCEVCGVQDAVEVHHLTYERVGRELLSDLVAVCHSCHDKLHPRVEKRAGRGS